MDFFITLILNAVFFVYKFVGSLGWAIIILTLLIRFLLWPLIAPSVKLSQKMKEVGPEVEKLKRKYGKDKQGLAKAQMELYRQRGINPAAGCLPAIIQIFFLFAFYNALYQIFPGQGKVADLIQINNRLHPFVRFDFSVPLESQFFYLNLTKPDVLQIAGLPAPGLFLILAALTQFLSSKMMSPAVQVVKQEAGKTSPKADDLMGSMQSQMLYLFPLMTILIGFVFPSGLILYWFVFSVFQFIQQYFMTGWGGLTPWMEKLKILK